MNESVHSTPPRADVAPGTQWRLHRLLIWRIAGTALVLAGLIAILVYVLEQGHIRDLAIGLAVQRAAEFTAVAGTALIAPADSRHSEIQAHLDAFAHGRMLPREGGIVAARLFATDGAQLAGIAASEYPQHESVERFLDNQTVAAVGESSGHFVDIDGLGHVFVQLPMRMTAGDVGQMLAVFAPSQAYLDELQRRIWRAVAAAVALVLVTATVLYPVILRLMRRVAQLSADLLVANLEMLKVLGGAIAKRDADTDVHNYRVTIYSIRLAERVGLDVRSMQALIKGAFLHDVGKIGVPDHILLKPGKLDEVEFAEMKKHVDYGLDIVQRAGWLADAEAVVGYHHRKFDGSGYGGRSQTAEVPIIARIFAIADVFDALTSKRPYKEPFSLERALGIMEESRGTHFDPQLLDAFAEIAGPLHEEFANRDDAGPQQALKAIVMGYFQNNLDSLI